MGDVEYYEVTWTDGDENSAGEATGADLDAALRIARIMHAGGFYVEVHKMTREQVNWEASQ